MKRITRANMWRCFELCHFMVITGFARELDGVADVTRYFMIELNNLNLHIY
jgi:hypothetical protein